ncbi:MAG: cation:proton antiporter [Rickettsiales bacterium]|jgi:Kef-type K+ transport system membrane component KefB|nr:cation:proton antiporter [Rickettsiales bacterium]
MTLHILLFFAMAFALVYLMRRARIGAIMAFLLAGVLAGEHVLGIFHMSDTWVALGDIGIIFLWFMMGLELNIRRLWQLRGTIFGLGAAQVLMVVVMLFPVLFGFTTWSILGTVMVALLLAMSSTSADLRILSDRNELHTRMGRQVFSVLLFQDLLSIPLLAMLPVFAGRALNLGAEIVDVAVLSMVLIFVIVLVGRYLLNPAMRIVARIKSKEAFLLAVMLVIGLCAVAVEFVGLPPSLGAFLGGMLLSETLYRHQIQVDIEPYQILFLSMFFIVLGMGLNLPFLGAHWWVIILGVIGLIVLKFSAMFIVSRIREVPLSQSVFTALLLAQGGEFGLLILQTMRTRGIESIPPSHAEILIAVIVLSMILTPVLLMLFDRYGKFGALPRDTDIGNIKPVVIIAGFGRVGKTIARMLASQKIPYVAIDANIDTVVSGRAAGFNVYYGDTKRAEVLRELGLNSRTTRAVVIALDNTTHAKSTLRAVRSIGPRIRVFARARNMDEAALLSNEGAKLALPETVESSFMLGEQVLENLGVRPDDVHKLLNDMRQDNYKKLEG